FQRFVSKNNLHIIASKITINSLDKAAQLEVETGIDAQQTNFGKQHVHEEEVQVFDEKTMRGVYKTSESAQTIAIAVNMSCSVNANMSFNAKNRQLLQSLKLSINKGESCQFEKVAAIYTSLDQDLNGLKPEHACIQKLKQFKREGYDELLQKSAESWK